MTADATQTTAAPLQFDRVVHADPAATRLQCASCSAPVVDTYYHVAGQELCARCGATRLHDAAPDRRASTMLRAILFGLGACVVGAVAYWAVMKYLDLEIGLVAIAIGFFVGRAIARATGGRSARRHRILAVALTYTAVGLAYAPFAFEGVKGKHALRAGTDSSAASTLTTSTSSPTTAASAPAARGAEDREAARTRKVPAATVALEMGALLVFVLALPLMGALSSGAGGILSVLIIGFGMRQAWKVSAASNVTVTGPLPVAKAPAT